MDNTKRAAPLNTVHGTRQGPHPTTSTSSHQQRQPQSHDYDWRSHLTPNKLKMYHTILVGLFIVLILTYILNFKSNILRVLVIVGISINLFCESYIIYSYLWE